MADVKNSKRSDKRSVLIIAKRNEKTKKLAHLLVDFFNEIRFISVLEEIDMVISSKSFTAIVVTDSLGVELNKDILPNYHKVSKYIESRLYSTCINYFLFHYG